MRTKSRLMLALVRQLLPMVEEIATYGKVETNSCDLIGGGVEKP